MLEHIEIENIFGAERLAITPGRGVTLITGEDAGYRGLFLDAAWTALTGQEPASPGVGISHTRRPSRKRTMAPSIIRAKTADADSALTRHEMREGTETYSWETSDPPTERTLVYLDADGTVNAWIGSERRRWYVMTNGSRLIASYTCFDDMPGDMTARERVAALHNFLRTCLPSDYPAGSAGPLDFCRTAAKEPWRVQSTQLLTMAIVTAWAWSRTSRNAAEHGLLLMAHDPETHLHPRRQRTIVERLRMIGEDAIDSPVQAIVSTVSPLVLASAEPGWNPDGDRLWRVERDRNTDRPESTEIDFVRSGTADRWLMSPTLGLETPRNEPAERAIVAAKALQLDKSDDVDRIRSVDSALTRALADDDEFWPRWRYWADKKLDNRPGTA